jgi:hypothetical protein
MAHAILVVISFAQENTYQMMACECLWQRMVMTEWDIFEQKSTSYFLIECAANVNSINQKDRI